MNPRTNLEDGNKCTVRAFVTLFRRSGDQFQFARDSNVDDSEEVRANLVVNDNKNNEDSVIVVTSINEKQKFNNIKETINDMNLDIVSSDEHNDFHESIGDYTAYTLEAKAVEEKVCNESWNVPHLIVYGSINPEIRRSIEVAFEDEFEYKEIRNHFVIYGDDITNNSKTVLSDAIQNTADLFDDQKRTILSSVNTSEVV